MSYLPRVKIVGTKLGPAGGYLQEIMIVGFEDEKGRPFVPVPPKPPEQLVVDTPTETSGSTVLGSVLTGTPATFTGGEPPVIVKTRWERSSDGVSGWAPLTDWEENGPTTYTTVAADEDRYLRFNTQATDAQLTVVGSFGDVIGPMTAAPVVIVNTTKYSNGTFLDTTPVYGFETLTVVPAVYSGGFGPLDIKTRWQKKDDAGSNWVNQTGWVDPSLTTVNVSSLTVGNLVRFQTRAQEDPSLVSSSPVATVAAETTIGTVSIAPPNTSADPDDVIIFDAINSGTASPFYIWSIRSGPGRITSGTNLGPQIEVTVNSDASSGATIQVQVDGSDPSAPDSPQGSVAIIVVN